MIPKRGLWKKPTETAPKINKGLEEFVKETRRSASICVNCPSWRNLAVNFAPAGKPEASPIAQTNPPTPGTLNRGLISGSSKTPINLTTPKPINISDTMKKGSNEGKTISHHILSPRCEASNDSCGKEISETANIVTETDKKTVFNFERCKWNPPKSLAIL